MNLDAYQNYRNKFINLREQRPIISYSFAFGNIPYIYILNFLKIIVVLSPRNLPIWVFCFLIIVHSTKCSLSRKLTPDLTKFILLWKVFPYFKNHLDVKKYFSGDFSYSWVWFLKVLIHIWVVRFDYYFLDSGSFHL